MRNLIRMTASAVCLALATSPAFASCCDDLLSCAAAVVTEGLSCVVVETVKVVDHLLGKLRGVMDNVTGAAQSAARDAVRQLNEGIASTRRAAKNFADQLAAAEQQATAICNKEGNLKLAEVRNPAAGGTPAAAAQPLQWGTPRLGGGQAPPATARTAASPPAPSSATSGRAAPAPAVTAMNRGLQSSGPSAMPAGVLASAPPATSAAPLGSLVANTQRLAVSGSPQAAVAAQQPPALRGAYTVELARALNEVTRLTRAGAADATSVATHMDAAAQLANADPKPALDLVDRTINGPISILAAQLLTVEGDPSKVFDLSSVVDSAIDTALSQLDSSVAQMVDSIAAGPLRESGAAQPALASLQSGAARAQAIVRAMADLQSARTPDALTALQSLLPPTATSRGTAGAAAGLGTTTPRAPVQARTLDSGQFAAARIKVARPPKIGVADVRQSTAQLRALKVQALQARSTVPALQSELTRQFNQAFTGRGPGELAPRRDELIVAARGRFTTDPKLRDAVIRLVTSEAEKRRAGTSPLQ